MEFATAKNHPKEELEAARQWYANAIGHGALETLRREGLALVERGRDLPETVIPYWQRCNQWGCSIPRKGIVITICQRCKRSVTWQDVDADREFFRSIENDRAREYEPFDADLWRALTVWPLRKGPVPDVPFAYDKGLGAVRVTRNPRSTYRKLRNTEKALFVPFDPTHPPTQRDIQDAIERAKIKRPRPVAVSGQLTPRDGGIKRPAALVVLLNNGYMLAVGTWWKHCKKPARKLSPGLPYEMAQLRMLGLTYPEIAKRFGMLESQVRLL